MIFPVLFSNIYDVVNNFVKHQNCLTILDGIDENKCNFLLRTGAFMIANRIFPLYFVELMHSLENSLEKNIKTISERFYDGPYKALDKKISNLPLQNILCNKCRQNRD